MVLMRASRRRKASQMSESPVCNISRDALHIFDTRSFGGA